ncbi:MAG: collagen-like protein [Acidobacteria bacterium]|nr:collagen-like protein [Acidobacteriota bacterium]
MATPASNFGIAIAGVGATSLQLDTRENTGTSHPAVLEVALVGPAGTPGAPGLPGPPGAPGAPGLPGLTGAPGAQGLAGAQGPAGPTGPQGPQGAAGVAGAQGLAGAQGPQGPQGPAGPAGITGATGSIGVAGPQGPAGATGPQGFTGAAGLQGPTGPAGPAGAAGANGPTSNHFALDPTMRPSGYTIPDTDTYLYYLVNNPAGTSSACGGAATLNLPHSTVVGAGRMVIASPGNVPNSTASQCVGVAVAVQGGDTLLFQGSGSSLSSAHPITTVSDGAGHWIVMNTDGR